MSKEKKKSIVLLTIVGVLMITLLLFIIPLNGRDSFQLNEKYDFYWISTAISKGLDLQGGMYAEYEAKVGTRTATSSEIDGAIANLESILFSKGYTEASVTKQGTNQVRVEVPDVQDTESLMRLLGRSATLEFRDSDGKVWITGSEHLRDAYAAVYDNQYVIKLEFNALGKRVFAEATGANVGKNLSIYIDNVEVMSPRVNEAINDGTAIISGNYTYESSNDYAVRIKAGISTVKLSLLRTDTISPTLGAEALSKSLLAAGIGLALIMIFMVVVYRGLGLASALALGAYVELLILFLAIVPWVQLTLNGIAGAILSIGMAVDANVVIFERIKEEKSIGRKLIPSAINTGFKKAFITVMDSNVTTILGSIIMIIFGSSAIKSFAITLLIGVVLSFISAITITRFFVNCFMTFDDESEAFYGLKAKEAVANV